MLRERHTPRPKESAWTRLLIPFIGYTVTTLWATSFIVGLINPKYTPPAGIQALMMVVAGSAFAFPLFIDRERRNPRD